MQKIIFYTFAFFLFIGCSANKQYVSNTSINTNREISLQKTNHTINENKRILIYSASVTLEVKNPDSTNHQLGVIAQKYDGYVLNLTNKSSSIRVKTTALNEAISDIANLGKVKDKKITGQDLTEQYTDLNVRLENANNARKRYLELMEKAENVEAALKIEKELERLNGEIDMLKGKINKLEHLSEFSTIVIQMEDKVKPGVLGYIGIGLYKSIKWLFVRN